MIAVQQRFASITYSIFFVIEKCEASAIFGSFELYLRTKQLILSPEYIFFLLFLLMLAICGIPVVYLGPQISVNFPICIPSGGHCWLLLYRVQPFKSRYIWKEILNGTIIHERFYFLIVGHSVFQTHFHGHMMCKHITTLSLRQIPIQDVMDCSNHGWILKRTMQSNHWAYYLAELLLSSWKDKYCLTVHTLASEVITAEVKWNSWVHWDFFFFFSVIGPIMCDCCIITSLLTLSPGIIFFILL